MRLGVGKRAGQVRSHDPGQEGRGEHRKEDSGGEEHQSSGTCCWRPSKHPTKLLRCLRPSPPGIPRRCCCCCRPSPVRLRWKVHRASFHAPSTTSDTHLPRHGLSAYCFFFAGAFQTRTYPHSPPHCQGYLARNQALGVVSTLLPPSMQRKAKESLVSLEAELLILSPPHCKLHLPLCPPRTRSFHPS